jgi:N-acetylneuraminate synthase
MIKSIRKADLVKGNGEKVILNEEIELRQFATRSIQAIKNISKGEILQEGINFDILRPGNNLRGLEARFLNLVNGKKSKKDIKLGDGITEFE